MAEKVSLDGAWPGAFGVYKFSKKVIENNTITFLVLLILTLVVGGGVQYIFDTTGGLISLIVGAFVNAALICAYFASTEGKTISVEDSFRKGYNYWLKMIVVNVLVSVIAIVSFLALIIPFFIVMPRVLLAPYFLIDKDLDIVDSIKASWEATQGHVGKIYGIIGASILMSLPIITLIGIPVALYLLFFYSAAFVLAYKYIIKSSPKKPAAQSAI